MDHDEVFVDQTGIVDQRLAAGAGSAASAVTGFVYGDPPEAPGVDAATRACIERLAIGSQVGVPATRGLSSPPSSHRLANAVFQLHSSLRCDVATKHSSAILDSQTLL